jgi:cell division protein FtsZ
MDSFCLADDFLRQGIQGISELITVPGIINLDFADVKTIMAEGGAALMGVGEAEGQNRSRDAAERAITSNLLDLTIHGAKAILFNVSGGPDLSLQEVYEAAAIVREMADTDVNLIFGAVIDDNMLDKIRVTVVATGFESSEPRQRLIQNIPLEKKAPIVNNGKSKPKLKNTTIGSNVWGIPEFANDDLAIPAFLRRR